MHDFRCLEISWIFFETFSQHSLSYHLTRCSKQYTLSLINLLKYFLIETVYQRVKYIIYSIALFEFLESCTIMFYNYIYVDSCARVWNIRVYIVLPPSLNKHSNSHSNYTRKYWTVSLYCSESVRLQLAKIELFFASSKFQILTETYNDTYTT